jgi:hypothetical protein
MSRCSVPGLIAPPARAQEGVVLRGLGNIDTSSAIRDATKGQSPPSTTRDVSRVIDAGTAARALRPRTFGEGVRVAGGA